MNKKIKRHHWGFYQIECHRLLDECFDGKGVGRQWLKKNFGINHFSQLDHKTDLNKIIDIYDKLYALSFRTEITYPINSN